jgi:ferredoxin
METTFSVTLINEEKELNQTLEVPSDQYIQDVADEEGIELPYSCRAGSCFNCLAKVVKGTVEQNEQALKFLKPDEVEAGYILLCVSSPASNCTILTHQEEEFLS